MIEIVESPVSLEIVEARRHHCGVMARRMRHEHRAALIRLGADPHRELRACFDQSAFRKAWFIDGELAALGGVTGSTLATHGMIWLAVSERATRYPKAMIGEARRQIDTVMRAKHELSTKALGADGESLRFARRLGFHVEHPIPLETDGVYQLKKSTGFRRAVVRKPASGRPPFIIYTAGRSRTAWLSSFLTYGDFLCHNEIAVRFRSMDEVAAFFARPNVGTAETAAAPGWRLIEKIAPGIRTVVVRRDAESIIASFARSEVAEIATIDEVKLRRTIAYEERCLAQISARPGVLTVDFSELTKADVAKKVFEHCLPYEFDLAWWEHMNARNVQTPVRDLFAYYQANRDGIEGFKRAAKRFLIDMVRGGEILSNAVG